MRDSACEFVRSIGLKDWIMDGEFLRKGDVSIETVHTEHNGINYVIIVKEKKVHVSRCIAERWDHDSPISKIRPAPMHDVYFQILTHTNAIKKKSKLFIIKRIIDTVYSKIFLRKSFSTNNIKRV